MNLPSSRRRVLKFIGIGTVSAVSSLLFNKYLDNKSSTSSPPHIAPDTSTLALEKLLLETGKEHLPQELYETTLRHLDS
ncbi:hypothetical protein Q2T42_19885 [Leptolyngbya boryana CZ1]|uniref:Uncharacterized protein n=1 Tax=Leptolyngbya boryana CZ1 TaxID=3060204 RepID=A0AA97ALK1_LEPBY|nr:hypothetical protein [Leptolyngbya boryana]WNZ44093.1 hypothetical protein Q2T42_19885 [Leptolyngbya boryana CZ1]